MLNSLMLLLKAVVPRMAHHDTSIAEECQTAVRLLLISDAEGKMAREAVQLVADLVRVRKCQCSPAVVRVLLSLDLADAEAPGAGQKPGEGVKLPIDCMVPCQ